jgi:hypothetical protein
MTHLHIALLAGAGTALVVFGLSIGAYYVVREFVLTAMEIENGRRP